MSRQERQRDEISAALDAGDCARVLVLAREHLAEFPSDEDVKVFAAEARRRWLDADPAS
jgi:hypothetical protein